MPSLNQIRVDSVFAMFKGEPGTRKSTQALSFPLPQYWFSTDFKMNALKVPAQKWGVDMSKVVYDDYKTWPEILAKMETLRVNHPYRTIIVDSVTSLADTINLGVMKDKMGSTGKTGESKGAKIGGIPVSSIEDYKAENSAFVQMISLLKDTRAFNKCHIILIAHVVGERSTEQTGGVSTTSRIIITGGKTISGKIPAYCDETYHFETKKGLNEGQFDHKIWTRHTGGDFARTALPLESEIKFNDDPLYEKWIKPAMDKLNGDVK